MERAVEGLSELEVAHSYKPERVFEEETVPLTWLQEMFVTTGMTPADLLREEKPKPTTFGDGLSDIVGY
jgi:hypothetical protein